MKAPPDLQIAAILSFLYQALRSDEEIQKWTGARPEEIVASTVEFKPIESDGSNIYVYKTELPVLALHIVRANSKPLPGTKRGRKFTAHLWYLFETPQSESAELSGEGKAERIKGFIWWRIQHWLMYQKLPISDEYTFDLQDESKIRTLEMGDTEWFSASDWDGLKMTLDVHHAWAPYPEQLPPFLAQTDITITDDAGAGNSVGMEVTTS